MTERLTAALSAMLGGDAGVGYADGSDDPELFPEEAQAIARAIPKRRAEFAAGRRAARAALVGIGQAPQAILVGEHRAPLWPRGMVGAITHDDGTALAAVLPDRAAAGLGIDLTAATALPAKVDREILPHADEQGLSPLDARTGFSAKESLFKALFPLVGAYFGFSAAVFRPGLTTFHIELTVPIGPFAAGTGWTGQCARDSRHILTALRLPPL